MPDLDAYFSRIRHAGSRAPGVETLRELHRLHPLAIPFENLDTLAGRPVLLDEEALARKLIAGRRGGYCFEHNLLFGHVLRALGYRASGLAARVLWNAAPGDRAASARTHMLLIVEVGEDTYLSDVGFGGLTLTAPLLFEPDLEQATPHETFAIVREGDDFVLRARLGAEWKPLYSFDLQRQSQIDIEVLNHFVSTHAGSPFIETLMVARPSPDRRLGLTNGELTVRHADGRAERRQLASASELREVLEADFGIDVPRDDATERALRRVLARDMP